MNKQTILEWIQQKEVLFYSIVALSLILSRVPIIGKFIKCVNTLIHESGHAFTALITSGSVLEVELLSDTSGSATIVSKSWIAKVLVSISGYVFSSAVSFGMLYLLKHNYFNHILYFLIGLAVFNLIFWVRNLYGIIWILIFGALCGGVLYLKNENLTLVWLIVVCTIVFSDALFSTIELLFISIMQPKKSSDAVNLAKSTWLPAFIWALLFVGQAVGFAYLSVKMFSNGAL
ncbi:MAG: M50 family metallopeptidase [Bacteroidota bacterium]